MKKLIFLSLFIASPLMADGPDVKPYIETGLIDRISIIGQLESRGTARVGAVSSLVRCGQYRGMTIAHLQAGVNWDTHAENDEDQSATPTIGVLFRVDPFVNPIPGLPANWETLNSLEHGFKFDYEFHEHQMYVGYQVGFTFKLNPIK